MAPRARRPRWKSNADSSMGSALALRRCFRGKSGCLSAESSMPGAAAPAAGGPGRRWDGTGPLPARSQPGRNRAAPLPPSSLVCAALRGPMPGVALGAPSPRAGLLSVPGHRGGPVPEAAGRPARPAERTLPAAPMAWACSASSLPRGRSRYSRSAGLEGAVGESFKGLKPNPMGNTAVEAWGKPKEQGWPAATSGVCLRVGVWEHETSLCENLRVMGCTAGAVVNRNLKEPLCFD